MFGYKYTQPRDKVTTKEHHANEQAPNNARRFQHFDTTQQSGITRGHTYANYAIKKDQVSAKQHESRTNTQQVSQNKYLVTRRTNEHIGYNCPRGDPSNRRDEHIRNSVSSSSGRQTDTVSIWTDSAMKGNRNSDRYQQNELGRNDVEPVTQKELDRPKNIYNSVNNKYGDNSKVSSTRSDSFGEEDDCDTNSLGKNNQPLIRSRKRRTLLKDLELL